MTHEELIFEKLRLQRFPFYYMIIGLNIYDLQMTIFFFNLQNQEILFCNHTVLIINVNFLLQVLFLGIRFLYLGCACYMRTWHTLVNTVFQNLQIDLTAVKKISQVKSVKICFMSLDYCTFFFCVNANFHNFIK